MLFTKKEEIIHITASGNILSIDVFEFFNNKESDEVIYIQGGIHGIELIGTVVIYELIKYIEEKQPKINIICVPISNPFSTDSQIMGLQTGYNNIHTNTMNCLNYNRLGKSSSSKFESQIVEKLFDLVKHATLVIDLHCSGIESQHYIYCNKKLVEDAKKFGIPTILYRVDDEVGNAFEDQCFLLGKKAFTLELGPSRKIDKSDVDRALSSVIQFLFKSEEKEYMIKDQGNLEYIFAPVAGFLVWNISIGQKIYKGMEIANIYTRTGIHVVISNIDGIFFAKDPIAVPYQYQNIGILLKE